MVEASAIKALVVALTDSCGDRSLSSRDKLNSIADALQESLSDVRQLLDVAVTGKKEVRVLLNGCFDIMHAGHYNALRQAKAAFSRGGIQVTLVAGVHSDEAIMGQKGPTVMKDDERRSLVGACKWVDEVAFGLPYLITPELLDELKCDFVAHGDDLPIRRDGTGMYDTVIAANRFKMIKRTEGTSTTVLIGRLLSMSMDHLIKVQKPSVAVGTTVGSVVDAAAALPCVAAPKGEPEGEKEKSEESGPPAVDHSKLQSMAMLLPTSERISQFADIRSRDKHISQAKKVVYIDGAFDLFHVGHMAALRAAAEHGDFVLVGLHSDNVINERKGRNYPIQNLHERAFCVLSCQYANEVILGAPACVTHDLITTMNVKVVVCGAMPKFPSTEDDPYAVPREMGILAEIDSGSTMTTDTVIRRIIENRTTYLQRNKGKEAGEIKYLSGKKFVAEEG